MANVTTLALGGTSNIGTGFGTSELYVHEIDIADAVAAGLATTEDVKVLNFPADCFFELLQVEVVTALSLGAGARIDLGDSSSDTLYVNNATTLTAGTNLTIATGSKLYTAANTLDLKVTGGTIATGVLRFVFRMSDTSRIAVGGAPDL